MEFEYSSVMWNIPQTDRHHASNPFNSLYCEWSRRLACVLH